MSLPFLHRPPPIRGAFRTDDAARAVYSESAGVLRRFPRAVAVPADPDDVRALVRWAASERLALIPRGSGSSMAGAAVGDGVVVDLSRLTDRSPVDNIRRTIRAGAGVVRREVEHAANAVGLRFPVDPSSGTFATIGGMTATNAAGPRTLAHGAMRRWVEAVDCVFDDGSRATIRRGDPLPSGVLALDRWSAVQDGVRAGARRLAPPAVRKDSSGYGVHDFADSGSLVDLLVGSEGTLALLVAVELRLAPVPEATASVLVAWPTLDHAVAGAALARAAGASACELLDRTFLDVARSAAALPVPDETECVLLIELEEGEMRGELPAGREREGGERGERARASHALERGEAVAARADALAHAFESHGAISVLVGLDAESEESLWALRHAASPILSRLDPHLKSMQLVEDGCVPPERLADYVRGVRTALDAAHFRGVVFGHAGDAHVHVNALVDVREPDWRPRVRQLFDDVVSLTASLGGTLSGEHGDGRLRTPSLVRTWSPEARALFAQIKHCFDPVGIFNPGVIVPSGPVDGAKASDPVTDDQLTDDPLTDHPLADNKYDPELPPHPPAARAVLDRVELQRAYDRPRLEMLDHDT